MKRIIILCLLLNSCLDTPKAAYERQRSEYKYEIRVIHDNTFLTNKIEIKGNNYVFSTDEATITSPINLIIIKEYK